jgi:hypothetical protein
MRDDPMREFRRADCPGDDRITLNVAYVVSVAPDPASADRAVIRIATGRGFEEYTLRGGYEQVRNALRPAAVGG